MPMAGTAEIGPRRRRYRPDIPGHGRKTMQARSIYVIGAIGKTGGSADDATGHAESQAGFQEPSDGQTAVGMTKTAIPETGRKDH